VLGLSPYRSAADVWADPVGRVPRETQDAVHLRFGRHAESFVAAEYERATGRALVECPQTLFHPEHGFMFAHVDRLVLERAGDTALEGGRVTAPGVLECKTANAFSDHGWGETGSDRVPAAYLAQCAWADLAVLIGNSDFRVYRLARDPELEAQVLGRAKAFWYENVLAQRPPAARTRPPSSPARHKGARSRPRPRSWRRCRANVPGRPSCKVSPRSPSR
jgi:predicted phage-related endonuclease